MRREFCWRPALFGLALLLGLPATAHAIQRPSHLQGRAQLELAPGAARTQVRTHRARVAAPAIASPSRSAITAEVGADAWLSIDADTGVLATVIPRGMPVSGQIDRFAVEFVARHIDALAPGAVPSDLVLVSDQTSVGVRTIGFSQHHRGIPIVGAQLSLSFVNNHLVAVRSQALPHVSVPTRTTSVAALHAGTQARTWIADDFAAGQLDRARVDTSMSTPMILPLVGVGGAMELREVVTLEIVLDRASAGPMGRWLVYVDAATGQPIARRSLMHWAELQMNTWQRLPTGPRTNFPASFLDVLVSGQPATTNSSGQLTISTPNTPVEFGPNSPLLNVTNANGPTVEISTMLDVDEGFVWDLGTDPEQDAHLSAYVHAQAVKAYIRGIDPSFAPLDQQTLITVNINDVCNAFADGNTLNFFLSDGFCQNTALIADVVYHEYGHVAHVLGLQPGVGLFEGAVSEGASDYLSCTITGDPELSPGFFLGSEMPLRDLDPPGFEWTWPDDTGEVHDEGQILGGALWDLRKALIAKYGQSMGVRKTDEIWLGGIQRSTDMMSWYLEALVTNDDDGNLQNGTPDDCEITEAFTGHGIYEPLDGHLQVQEVEQPDGSVEITVDFPTGESQLCAPDVDPSAVLRYRPRDQPFDPGTEIAFIMTSPGTLRALIPPQPEHTVTQYQVEFAWGNGISTMQPDNRADPWFEYFSGETVEIWCSDFEGDDGWALDGEWSIGAPGGGGGDPGEAYEGSRVAGIALDFPGIYSPFSNSRMRSPTIDTAGHDVVRLQYRRWLTIEDGFFDQASITANGATVWENFTTDWEDGATIHHRDHEWRFHDVDLSDAIGPDGQLTLEFQLGSDQGLEFGGWNVDDLCIVGTEPGEPPVPPDLGCGDGQKQSYEQCDDGNLASGDGCSPGCLFEEEPPPEEPLDDNWDPNGRDCSCTTDANSNPAAPLGLLVVPLLWLGLRRRRQPSR